PSDESLIEPGHAPRWLQPPNSYAPPYSGGSSDPTPMEYRLTFPTLILGSLACGLSILAIAWIFELLRGFDYPERSSSRSGRPGSTGEALDWSGRGAARSARACSSGAFEFEEPHPVGIGAGIARESSSRRSARGSG